jgi:hypothetical protein
MTGEAASVVSGSLPSRDIIEAAMARKVGSGCGGDGADGLDLDLVMGTTGMGLLS